LSRFRLACPERNVIHVAGRKKTTQTLTSRRAHDSARRPRFVEHFKQRLASRFCGDSTFASAIPASRMGASS
jgi:hypothetical protein